MSYKIESGSKTHVVVAPRPAAHGTGSAAAASASAPPTDSLKVTDQGRLAARIVQTARELPAVDAQRVAQARSAIDSGQYSVNSAAIASRMLQMEWQLTSP